MDTSSTCTVALSQFVAVSHLDAGEITDLSLLESRIMDLMATTIALSADVDKLKKASLPVYLHIYDVSQEDSVHKLNKWLAHPRNPLKFGGVFHAGVEIDGLEWSYGASDRACVPGISCCEPRCHRQHRYRETLTLQNATISPEEIGELLTQMIEEYPGHDYDLLRRNCCHFADDFCRRLGAGGIPGWVHRLARVGAGVDALMYKVLRHRLPLDDLVDDCNDDGAGYWSDEAGELHLDRASAGV